VLLLCIVSLYCHFNVSLRHTVCTDLHCVFKNVPGETGNPEIASFHLNAACLLLKNTRNTLKSHLVRAEPPFSVKTIDWVHQTGPRKGA